MISPKSNIESEFIEYNDENLGHVLSGPDYGQPSGSLSWDELSSKEYIDFVNLIRDKILSTKIKLVQVH